MLIAADFVLILLQNLFFTDLVGISSVSRASKGKFTLLLHGLLVMLFCILSAGLTAAVRGLLPNNTQVLLFPLLNAAFCGIADLLICVILRQISIKKYARIAPQIHSAACSCAVLGAAVDFRLPGGVDQRRGGFRGLKHRVRGLADVLVVLAVIEREEQPVQLCLDCADRGFRIRSADGGEQALFILFEKCLQ